MNALGVVFGAEISRRIRSRPFIIATLLGALLVAFIADAPRLFGHMMSSQTDTIVLAGPAALRAPAEELLRKDFHIAQSIDALPSPLTIAYLDAHDKAGAAIAISQQNGHLHVDVYARDLTAWSDIAFEGLAPLSVHLATGQPLERTRGYVVVDRALHGLDLKFSDSSSAAVAHGLAVGLVTILYISIMLTAQSVVSAVAEEKTNRIAELLVATISPVSLLIAKVLAAVCLALLQIAVWLGAAALLIPGAFGHVAAGAAAGAAAPAIPFETLAAFIAFFILGFLQYATLYAAAASLISRTEDLGSVSAPIVLPVVAGFLIAQLALINPNAPFIVVFSCIPFISPFVMFTRIALETVPAWQVALSLAINVATAAAAFYAAGKIYRVGMLLYGKLPSLRQIAAVLRQ
jgi:ABC-2 type transport system permease protein